MYQTEPDWVPLARQLRQERGWSYARIGRHFGFKWHTKVMFWLDAEYRERKRARNRKYNGEHAAPPKPSNLVPYAGKESPLDKY
jgi:hypothetical protein